MSDVDPAHGSFEIGVVWKPSRNHRVKAGGLSREGTGKLGIVSRQFVISNNLEAPKLWIIDGIH